MPALPSRKRISLPFFLSTILTLSLIAAAVANEQHVDAHHKRMTSSAPTFMLSPAMVSPPSRFMVSPQFAAIVVGALSVLVAGLMV
ncbi:MAG: hypothetical protein M1813_001975 [Trichoglossum hirsutum]|nr:MAG: hypothetical protein M1813_001975 [Trichoglossum hirsutum]